MRRRSGSAAGIGLAGAVLLAAAVAVGADARGDLRLGEREGTDVPRALFQHWSHRLRFKCYACHETPFPMKAGASRITMDAIGEGKACGVCHNGEAAFGVSFDTCGRCHPE